MMKLASPSRTLLTCLAIFLFFQVAGCPIDPNPDPNTTQNAKLVPFESSREFLSYFRQQARERTRRGVIRNLVQNFGAFGLAAAPTSAEDSAGGSSEPFSVTNLQEAGVDESDVVKTDGRYFYLTSGNSLRIVEAPRPNESGALQALTQVSRLDFDVKPVSLYLRNGKLIVLGQRYLAGIGNGDQFMIEIWPPYFQANEVVLYEIDIANPAAPAITRTVEMEGSLVQSRLTNNRLVLILTIVPDLPENPTTAMIDALEMEQVLPHTTTAAGERDLVPWQNWLRPTDADGYYMTAVVTLDADNIENQLDSVAVLAGAGTIYVSTEAVYVTNADYDVENNYREATTIHKLAFGEDGAARYTASGAVPGRLLNQFSLGEYEAKLRVATHVANWTVFDTPVMAAESSASTAQSVEFSAPYNAVYVLGENNGELAVSGAIENIAPGERIYSARFMGPRGFLVTFRQIDPLFALDLSDPTNPQIVGELKIPGFSDYLHPIGDDYLIGVGRAVDTSGGGTVPRGVQLSMFDVRDLTNPQLVQQIEIGGFGSYCDVSGDHKAFTYLAERGYLALPVQLYSSFSPFPTFTDDFRGVLCYRVTPGVGFEELGRVAAPFDSLDPYYWSEWRRGAFIGDVIYALTPAGINSANVPAFNQQASLAFTQ